MQQDQRTTALASIFEQTDWKTLMREGVIVKLTLRRWRAKTKLELSDLGITVEDPEVKAAYRQIMDLGNKLLLPSNTIRELENIDSSARKLLERYSYKTAFGRFVPYTAFERWRVQNDEWEVRYYGVRDAIVSDYAGIVFLLEQDYKHAARQAWTILVSTTPGIVKGIELEAFIANFLQRVKVQIPTPDVIHASFGYETNLMQIQFPTLTEANAEAQSVTAEDVAQRQTEREQERAASAERQRMLDQMNQTIVRDAQQKKQTIINAFLADLAVQVRSTAYEAVTDVLDVLRGAETLPGQSVRRLNTLIEQMSTLNFYNDRDLDRMITQMRDIVEQPAKDRNVDDIRRQLRAIATVTRATLIELGETPRSARGVDVPDVVSDADAREARMELQLDQPVEVASESPRGARIENADIATISGESRTSRTK